MGDGVAATAFVFEGTAAGAGSIAPDVLSRPGGRLGGLGDLVELEIAVEAVELDLGNGGFADGGTLGFDEFDDFHGGFESHGCGGLLVTQDLSKSVECEAGEVAEVVDETFRAVVAGGQEDPGEVGVFLFPEVDGGAMDADRFGGSGDGLARDEALEHLDLNRRQGVEWC